MNMNRVNPRPLRPAPARQQSDDPAPDPPANRRRTTDIACDSCRKRKTACDGSRPSCNRCIRKKVRCNYRPAKGAEKDELLSQISRYEQLLNHLRQLPEDESIEFLRRIRATQDPAKLLESLQGAAHSMYRPSDLSTTRQTGPPVSNGAEFELMVQHPAAYFKIMPVQVSFLERLVQIPTTLPHSPRYGAQQSTNTTKGENLACSSTSTLPRLAQTRPAALPRGKYCDIRLQQLQMDRWTRVPVENEFAAAVLSNYLENDHLVSGFFDADALLDDLANRRTQFCSSFILSSLMFLACQSYTAIDIRAAPLGLCFFEEAKMLYLGEMAVDSLTNVSGLTILCLASIVQGKDDSAQEYMNAAHTMAERLGLFGIAASDTKAIALHTKPADWIKAASYAAWGTYNFVALFNRFYPHDPIRYPPTLPLPGENVASESSTATSSSNQSLPRHLSPLFRFHCKLWVISQEIALVYECKSEIPIKERVPLAFIEAKYRKLLNCLDQLKHPIALSEKSPVHAVILHINFHAIVLNMLHPFIGDATKSASRLLSFTSPEADIRTTYEASVNQLKQLTLWSHIRYGRFLSIFFNAASLVLVSGLLRDDIQIGQEQRLYFLLCIRCCADLQVQYPIFVELTQAFLYMAVQRGAITIDESSALYQYVRSRGMHHPVADKAVLNCFSNQSLRENDPDKAATHSMAILFNDLTLFNKYTEAEDYMAGPPA